MIAGTRLLEEFDACLQAEAMRGRPVAVRIVHAGSALVRAGDAFRGLWIVRSGCLKSVVCDVSGAQQVVAFAMRGDVIGGDGLASGRYVADIVALEEAEVVMMRGPGPSDGAMTALSIGAAIASQLAVAQARHAILRALKADARVAAFLLALHARFSGNGPMRLSMMRAEIGSYLALSIETVSRSLSKFSARGLIRVDRREVEIVDEAGLQAMALRSWNGAGRGPAKVRPPARPRLRRVRTTVMAQALGTARPEPSAAAARTDRTPLSI